MDPNEALRRSIEALALEMREDRRARASASRTTPTPSTPSASASASSTAPTPMIPPGSSGTAVALDAEKIGKEVSENLQKVFATLAEKISEFTDSMRDNFGGIIERVLDFRNKLDEARSSMVKLTGAVGDSEKIYSKFAGSVRGLGISYGEAAAIQGEITKSIPRLLDLTEDQIQSTLKQAAALNRVGVATGDYVSSINTLNLSYGKSNIEARKTIAEIDKFSKALKVPPSVIQRDFATALPKLSQFGNRAIEIFKEGSIMATKFGIKMEDILGLADKFDTFESAAEAAGQLNVVFRQNLFDTQELLFADPIEKAKKFTSAMQMLKEQTGQSFEDMDQFAQKDVAKIYGLDLNTLKALSKMTTSEFEKQKANIKIGQNGQLTIEQTAQKTLTLTERLQIMQERLLSAFMPFINKLEPIISSVGKYIGMFIDKVGEINKTYPGLKSAITGIASAFAGYKMLQSAGITEIFSKLTDGMMSFIPYGRQLSGFVLPGLGVALGALVAKKGASGAAGKVGEMLGLSPEQTAEVEKQLKGVLGFVEKAFTDFLKFLNFNDADIANITDSIKSAFSSVYNVLFGENGDGGIFGTMKKILGSFFSAFKTSMTDPNNKETNPFLKLIKGITAGLKAAMETLTKELSTQGGETESIMKEFTDTLKSFVEIIKKSVLGVFSTFFEGDSGGKGIFDTINDMASSTPTREFATTLLKTFQEMMSGLGNIFNFFSGGANINFKASSEGLKTLMGTLKTEFADISIDGDIDDLGKAAAGIGELAKNIGNINDKTVTGFSKSMKELMPVFNELKSMQEINSNFITSIDKFATAINNLNIALRGLKENKDALGSLDFAQEKVTRFEALAAAVDRYAKALEKTKTLSSETDKLKGVLDSLVSAAASLKLDIDADKMGEIVGDKVAKAIRDRFR